jgi:hypothetical protein
MHCITCASVSPRLRHANLTLELPSLWCGLQHCKLADGVQNFYRKRPDSPIHSFRFIADFPSAGADLLALAREFDLAPSWNWSVPDAAILATRSDIDMDVYLVLYLPWPFSNRRAALRVIGSDMLKEEGALVVTMHSIDVDEVRKSALTEINSQ